MGLIQKEANASKKYELDKEYITYKKYKHIEIVKLTFDNVARVEAMIGTDSDYKNSSNINRGMIRDRNGKIKYIGSSAFWLNQLKKIIDKSNNETKTNYDYEQIINNLIIAIDNENSTHLNSDNIGRESIKKRILNISTKKLKDYLKNPGSDYKLISIIQTPQEIGEKNHLSFATKFCHYSCLHLFENEDCEDNFSIYDNVLKTALPKYIKKYLNEEVIFSDYENNYLKYISYIDRIRKEAEKLYGKGISRNGFDHLLWYFHKGR